VLKATLLLSGAALAASPVSLNVDCGFAATAEEILVLPAPAGLPGA